eukprot:1155504-Pelagomonas_calceolata.AAC.4
MEILAKSSSQLSSATRVPSPRGRVTHGGGGVPPPPIGAPFGFTDCTSIRTLQQLLHFQCRSPRGLGRSPGLSTHNSPLVQMWGRGKELRNTYLRYAIIVALAYFEYMDFRMEAPGKSIQIDLQAVGY